MFAFCHIWPHRQWVWLLRTKIDLVWCDSLWTTFHPEKKWIKRSTTFTSVISLFRLCLHFCVICHFLWFYAVSTCVLFLEWTVFGLSAWFVCFGLFSVTWFSLFGATPDFSCLPLPLDSAPFLWLQASLFLWTHLLLWWSQRFRNKISAFDITDYCFECGL